MPNDKPYNFRNSTSEEHPKSPAPGHSIADDLVQALQNHSVAEALAKALDPYIKLAVQETVEHSLLELNNIVQKITEENKTMRIKSDLLESENENLKKRLTEIEDYLEVVERNEKSHNVIIRGLPEPSYAERSTEGADDDDVAEAEPQPSVEKSVLNLLQKRLNIDAVPDNIISAFRLKGGRNDNTRPILVKFASRKLRDKVLATKRILGAKRNREQSDHGVAQNTDENSKIFISEQLSKKVSDLFFKARELKRKNIVHSTWTRNGKLYIKVSGDPNCKPKQIVGEADLPRQ